jgi:hypothetical protein
VSNVVGHFVPPFSSPQPTGQGEYLVDQNGGDVKYFDGSQTMIDPSQGPDFHKWLQLLNLNIQ